MKNTILGCLTATLIWGLVISVHAQDITAINQDISTQQLTVSVSTNCADTLVLQLLTKETTADMLLAFPGGDATALIGDLQMSKVEAGENTFNLMLPANTPSGEYIVRVYSRATDSIVEKTVWIYNEGDINEQFGLFVNAVAVNDAAGVLDLLENTTFRNALGVNEEFYSELSYVAKTRIAERLISDASEIAKPQDLSDRIGMYMLFEVLNAGKLIAEQETALNKYADIIGITNTEKYNAFSAMSSESKKATLAKLKGQYINGKTGFVKLFNESVVLTEIQLSGAAMKVPDIMNTNKVLLSAYNLDKYWNNTNNYKLNQYIYTQNFSSFAEMEIALNTYDVINDKPAGVGGSGGGGTGGNGGGYASTVTATTEQVDKHESMFTDLGDVSWCEQAVNALAERGVVNGKGNGLFCPNDTATRAEIVKMLTLSFGIETENTIELPFTDVPRDAWFYEYIVCAFKNNLVNGISNTEFLPDGLITREDMAVLVWRFIGNEDMVTVNTEPVGFIDKAQISEYAREAVGFLREIGVISGMEDGTFRPQEPCTRAQVSKMIYTALLYCGK